MNINVRKFVDNYIIMIQKVAVLFENERRAVENKKNSELNHIQ